jgi:two-component system chemotaxis response regulator CheB
MCQVTYIVGTLFCVAQSSVSQDGRPPTAPESATSAVVLAGSLGGLHAITEVLCALPAQFPAAIVVLLHRPARNGRDHLPDVLSRRSTLPVKTFHSAQDLDAGCVHVLPPRTSLTTRPGAMLEARQSEGWRTADATMTALAERYRSRSIGVVLSGRLDDGARGARAIKRAGGRVIVQDPADAVAPSMPAAAMATGSVDLVVPLRRVAPALVALTMAPGGADLLRTSRAPWAS